MEQTDPKSPFYPHLWVDPERLRGQPCFRGTRVHVATLIDYLAAGDSLTDFLSDFPSVKKEQAEQVLHLVSAWIGNAENFTAPT
jgi:uncharacterized protein (DUF433 family)